MRRAWSSRRVLRPGSGPTDGRQSIPARVWFWSHIGPIDSARPQKNAGRGPRRVLGSCGNRVLRRESSQMLWDDINPRLIGRSCGAFPVQGELCPSAVNVVSALEARTQLFGRASTMADERSANNAVKATVPLLLMAGCPTPIRVFSHTVSPVFTIKAVCVKIPAPSG